MTREQRAHRGRGRAVAKRYLRAAAGPSSPSPSPSPFPFGPTGRLVLGFTIVTVAALGLESTLRTRGGQRKRRPAPTIV